MELTLRKKLLGVVAIAALSLSVMAIVGLLSAREVSRQLDRIQTRLVPLAELRPQLRSDLERMARAYQDAVAAGERAHLAQADVHRRALLARVRDAEDAIGVVAASEIRDAVDDYSVSASNVSSRLLAGEMGDALAGALSEMHARRQGALEVIERVALLPERELEAAFARTVRLQERSLRLRLTTALACLLVVSSLTFLIIRHVLRSVDLLSSGLERFGRGEFDQPIVAHSGDELGRTAHRANEMAANLDAANRARDRGLWLGEGWNGLALELRGELTARRTAERATAFLVGYLKATAGALYYEDDSSVLRLVGHYGLEGPLGASPDSRGEPAAGFRRGDGLVGQAACAREAIVVDSLPPDHLRIRSGLGESRPRALLLQPLCPSNEATGVLELAFLGPVPEGAFELLSSAQRTVAIAMEVANARAASKALLAETQAQAERLALQEEELRATNEELTAQQEALHDSNQALAERGRALAVASSYKSRFLASMSHELRTPLNSMLLLSNLLADNQSGNLDDKQVEYCRTIYSAGQDLLGLIDQVLDLAKIEAGKVKVVVARMNLREVVERIRARFQPLARDKGLELEVRFGPELPEEIAGDRQRVLQVLSNLVGNAIKFTARGAIELRLVRPDPDRDLGRPGLDPRRAITFEVADTGPGIAQVDQERVFSAFEQSDGTAEKGLGGPGLGLAISRELAEALGGVVVLESEPGVGSTFSFHLPDAEVTKSEPEAELLPIAAGNPDTAPGIAVAELPRPGGTSLGLAGKKVLLIDADMRAVYSLSAVLQAEGCDVRVAESALEALDVLEQPGAPDAVLLDVAVPEAGGYAAMERIRDQGRFTSLPIIAFTSEPVSDGERPDVAAGATVYLSKPVRSEQLLRTLRARLVGGA